MTTSKYFKDITITSNRIISEHDILLVKRRLNHNKIDDCEVLDFFNGHINVSFEQQQKGKKWLINYFFTKSGQLRNNAQIRKLKQKLGIEVFNGILEIIKNLNRFYLIRYNNEATSFQLDHGINNYFPVYRAMTLNGFFFDYTVINGEFTLF